MNGTRLRPIPIAIATALAGACAVPFAPTSGFSIQATSNTAVEGEEVQVTLRRAATGQPGVAELRVIGDASVRESSGGVDAGDHAARVVTLEFPVGVAERTATLHVSDDPLTEAAETVRVEATRSGAVVAEYELRVQASDVLVSNTLDDGPGSLRQAIRNANELEDEGPIRFDSVEGPFGDVQAIRLASPLPVITGDVEIDGFIPERLWRASGVVIDGAGSHRIFEVAAGGHLRLRYLTLAGGRADSGGALRNEGTLLLSGVTLLRNEAERNGGAVFNLADAQLINVTFSGNEAGGAGGAVANEGRMVVTHATMASNAAPDASGLWSPGPLRLANSILAQGEGGPDCVAADGQLDDASAGNIIVSHQGCGEPLEVDPVLDPLGYYNGPLQTFALGGGSPAVHLAVNALSVDEHGEPLVWDARGNGDPRFVAGYADIGAFEKQAFPDFVVDTTEDNGLRGCTPSGVDDCPLRAAIELAIVSTLEPTITFHPRTYQGGDTLTLDAPLPCLTGTFRIDAGEHGPRRVLLQDGSPALVLDPTADVTLVGLD